MFDKFIIFFLLLIGFLIRTFYIHQHAAFMHGDEALVGIATGQMLTHSVFPIFLPLQAHSGMLLSYLVAPFVYFFGMSGFIFKTGSNFLSLALIFILYHFAKRIDSPQYARLVLAFASIAPPFMIMWSVEATAEYIGSLLFGALMFWFCDEILFVRKMNRKLAFGGLGLAQGIAFWLTPVSLPFHATVFIILALASWRSFFSAEILTWGMGLLMGMTPLLLFNMIPELREANGLFNSPNWISFSILSNKANTHFMESLQHLPRVMLALFQDSFPVLLGGAIWEVEESQWKQFSIVLLVCFWLLALGIFFWQRRNWKVSSKRLFLSRIDILLLHAVMTILLFTLNQKSRELTLEPRYLLPLFITLPFAAACLIEKILKTNRVLAWITLCLILSMNMGGVIWFSKSANPNHSLWPLDNKLIQYLIDHQIKTPIAGFWVSYPIAFATDQTITPIPIYLTRFEIYKRRAVLDGQNNFYFYIFPKHSPKESKLLRLITYHSTQGTFWSAADFQIFLSEKMSSFKTEIIEFEYYKLYKVHSDHLNPVSFVKHAGY